jgi:hypothetical protein
MNPLSDGWTMEEVEAVLARGEPAELAYVAVCVSMDPPDCDWAQDVCVRLAAHADPVVRGNAVLGFGHLARTCGTLDPARVRPLLAQALADADAYVRGQAHAAAGDVALSLGWDLTDSPS